MNPVCEQCGHSMRLTKQDDSKKYMNEHGMVKQEDGEWICGLLNVLDKHPRFRFHERMKFSWDDPIMFLSKPDTSEKLYERFEMHCPHFKKLELLIKMKQI